MLDLNSIYNKLIKNKVECTIINLKDNNKFIKIDTHIKKLSLYVCICKEDNGTNYEINMFIILNHAQMPLFDKSESRKIVKNYSELSKEVEIFIERSKDIIYDEHLSVVNTYHIFGSIIRFIVYYITNDSEIESAFKDDNYYKYLTNKIIVDDSICKILINILLNLLNISKSQYNRTLNYIAFTNNIIPANRFNDFIIFHENKIQFLKNELLRVVYYYLIIIFRNYTTSFEDVINKYNNYVIINKIYRIIYWSNGEPVLKIVNENSTKTFNDVDTFLNKILNLLNTNINIKSCLFINDLKEIMNKI
jgi:hypothetical protein